MDSRRRSRIRARDRGQWTGPLAAAEEDTFAEEPDLDGREGRERNTPPQAGVEPHFGELAGNQPFLRVRRSHGDSVQGGLLVFANLTDPALDFGEGISNNHLDSAYRILDDCLEFLGGINVPRPAMERQLSSLPPFDHVSLDPDLPPESGHATVVLSAFFSAPEPDDLWPTFGIWSFEFGSTELLSVPLAPQDPARSLLDRGVLSVFDGYHAVPTGVILPARQNAMPGTFVSFAARTSETRGQLRFQWNLDAQPLGADATAEPTGRVGETARMFVEEPGAYRLPLGRAAGGHQLRHWARQCSRDGLGLRRVGRAHAQWPLRHDRRRHARGDPLTRVGVTTGTAARPETPAFRSQRQ